METAAFDWGVRCREQGYSLQDDNPYVEGSTHHESWAAGWCDQDMVEMHGLKLDWTHEWPTEPGYYWFYGWCFEPKFRYEAEPPVFHFVEVQRTGNSVCYVTDGYFMYKAEGAEGIWQPVIFPELPPDDPPSWHEGAELWL